MGAMFFGESLPCTIKEHAMLAATKATVLLVLMIILLEILLKMDNERIRKLQRMLQHGTEWLLYVVPICCSMELNGSYVTSFFKPTSWRTVFRSLYSHLLCSFALPCPCPWDTEVQGTVVFRSLYFYIIFFGDLVASSSRLLHYQALSLHIQPKS